MDSGAAGLAGGVISGGLGLLGGFLSNEYNQDLLEQQIASQREAQQNFIQWRVEDAKKAGIHPLFALGANSPSTFPISMGDNIGPALREAGQDIGSATARMLDTQAKEKHQMDMALGAAQLSESDARREMYLSEAARNRQAPGAPMPGLGPQREGTVQGKFLNEHGQDVGVPGTGIIDLKPMDQTSAKEGNPDIVAGEHPGYQEMLYRGMPMLFPITQGESPEEILSEMSLPAYTGLLLLNGNTYGEGWITDFMKMKYLGKPAENHYPTIREQYRMGRMYKNPSWISKMVKKYLD